MLKPNYNNLWKLLIDKKIKKTQLKTDCKIAPGTMHKMNHDMSISMDVLARICEYLECDIGDVVRLEKVEGSVK